MTYGNRGNAKYQQGNYEGAVADYDRAITLNPNLAEALSPKLAEALVNRDATVGKDQLQRRKWWQWWRR